MVKNITQQFGDDNIEDLTPPPYSGKTQMLRKGVTYIVKEKKPRKSFDYFLELIRKENKGLCVSRRHPEMIKSRYEMNRTIVLWITTAMGEGYIHPTDIEALMNLVANFIIKNSDNSVVIMDGIEYLSYYNDIDKVLKSIYFLNDIARKNGAIVILPVMWQAFIDENRAHLEKGIEIIEPS